MKVKDKGKKKFLKQLKQIGKAKIQIGATGGHSNTDLTNADLMVIHEFGAPRQGIPARRPVKITFTNDDNLSLISKNLQGLLKQNYNKSSGFNINNIVNGIGETMRALLVATIKQGVDPNILDTSRARRRGSKTTPPLIDTGQMVNSITFRTVL